MNDISQVKIITFIKLIYVIYIFIEKINIIHVCRYEYLDDVFKTVIITVFEIGKHISYYVYLHTSQSL